MIVSGEPDDDEALEALREALNLQTPTHQLACWQQPTRVPGVGWVAEVTLFSTETYQGPRADLILAPATASVDDARDHALAAAARIVETGLDVAIELPLAETLGLRALDPDDPETVDLLTTPDTLARRRKALQRCRASFDAVARRFAEVYGLRLPRSLIAWAALVHSLGPFEQRGLDQLGRSGGGILIWFEPGGLERQPREGLDPRLDCRFRRDPPELVTIAWGDSDGLHYGLWFDDPAEPATTIVANYARDSSETWDTGHRDMLAVLRKQIAERDEYEPTTIGLRMLAAAIEWFAREAEPELSGKPASIWTGVERPALIGCMGPALRPEHGDPRAQGEQQRYAAYQTRDPQVRTWIEQAHAELERGQPAFALVLGRELHWFDHDEWRGESLALLVGAYRALGRDALAEIASIHHRHRDLGSVAVY
ncbi:ADP-ribosylation family protein [Nannocystaceae bacterium ST9]